MKRGLSESIIASNSEISIFPYHFCCQVSKGGAKIKEYVMLSDFHWLLVTNADDAYSSGAVLKSIISKGSDFKVIQTTGRNGAAERIKIYSKKLSVYLIEPRNQLFEIFVYQRFSINF